MAKKKKRSWAVAPRGFGSKNLDAELHKAEARIVHEQWADAYQILSALGQQYPQEKRIWMYLTQVCMELEHFRGYQQACEHWLEVDPNNGDLLYGLGFSYMVNQHPLLALQTFRRALECKPDHDGVDEVREAIPKLENFAAEAKANFAESAEDWWEIALRHEQAQAYLEEGEYARARQAEQDVLERQPDFLPARNNLSLVAWAEGDLDSAIATAQSVLDADPNNTHALSNVIRFLTQQGNDAAAQPYAERLKAADEPDAWNPWTKKVEGLSYLGDVAGVVEVYEQWQSTTPEPDPTDAFFHHLVAVAFARLDQPEAAKAQWKIALEQNPGMAIAEKNLKELLFPVGQRHGAWPFGLNEWLSPKLMADFQQVLVSLKRPGKANKLESTFNRFFDEHPAFIKQAPKILERGGPEGQSFLVSMAEQIHIPEFMQAIKDFGLGQNGTDQMRNQAVVYALKAGLVPRDKVRMWIEGEWRDVMLMGYELYGEPETGKHSRRVTDWLAEATSLLHEQSKDAALEAEEILQKALAVEPDAPDLLNNLAAAYMRLDREQEAEALILNIHEQFPDYLFACTSLAKFQIRDREFDAAETLLKPFFKHERFHFSEFAALMDAQIELEIARKNYQAAETWLDMWAKADPDHPLIEYWDERLEAIPEL